jgi:hypothetical protein
LCSHVTQPALHSSQRQHSGVSRCCLQPAHPHGLPVCMAMTVTASVLVESCPPGLLYMTCLVGPQLDSGRGQGMCVYLAEPHVGLWQDQWCDALMPLHSVQSVQVQGVQHCCAACPCGQLESCSAYVVVARWCPMCSLVCHQCTLESPAPLTYMRPFGEPFTRQVTQSAPALGVADGGSCGGVLRDSMCSLRRRRVMMGR